jgi:hypothetical protein
MPPLAIRGMLGLGDNIFARPFIRNQLRTYPEIYLTTSWPELYADIPAIHCVRPATRLRTQAKNVAAFPANQWAEAPLVARPARIAYGHAAIMRHGSIPLAIEASLPVKNGPVRMDLPPGLPFPAALLQNLCPPGLRRPIALIRPVTERAEWFNSARSPRPEYIARIASALMDSHLVVSVADLEPGAEWLVGEAPPAHVRLHAGELDVRHLLGLVQGSDVVVGGVGWIVPAGIAAGVKTFIVHGGMAAHNGPRVITDPRFNLTRYGYALPERFCTCATMKHDCIKTIASLASQWNRFASRHSLPPLPAERAVITPSRGGMSPESAISPLPSPPPMMQVISPDTPNKLAPPSDVP